MASGESSQTRQTSQNAASIGDFICDCVVLPVALHLYIIFSPETSVVSLSEDKMAELDKNLDTTEISDFDYMRGIAGTGIAARLAALLDEDHLQRNEWRWRLEGTGGETQPTQVVTHPMLPQPPVNPQ